MGSTDAGREPVQVVELVLPKCANTYGVAPCTAALSGDAKCFNTFATCQDPTNYRAKPEGSLGAADVFYQQGDVVLNGNIDRTADMFAAFDVRFPPTPSGTIFEQGGSGDGCYLGITGSNLVWRVGNGASGPPADTAYIAVPFSLVAGKSGTVLVNVDISADTANLWFFDPVELTLTLLGTDTAASSFTQWAGTGNGGVGIDNGVPAGEDGGDFNGTITEARLYDSTTGPADMSDNFRTRMWFTRKQHIGRDAVPLAGLIIYPFLTNIRSTGTRINVAGSNEDYDPLGNRASCTITLADGLGSDADTDPYLADRTYDPLTRSTFWLKFLARQKFGKIGALVRVYEGYSGDLLTSYKRRTYVVDRVDVGSEEGVTLYCRDILTKTELAKAQAPAASTGYLAVELLDTETGTFTTTGHELDDYPASGTVRINDELITYSAIADNGDGTFDWTITLRGSDNTDVSTQAVDDAVQECRRYTNASIYDVLDELLAADAGIDYQLLDLTGWDAEIIAYLSAYQLTTVISEPTAVRTLVGELALQCGFYIWWDERSQLVKLQAIRGLETEPAALTDAANLIGDSVRLVEKPDQRISQVWLYYNPFNPTEALDDPANYLNLYVDADLQAESEFEYNQRQIRTIFSRWLTTNALALQTSSRLIGRFSEVPVEVMFELDAKDRDIWVGDTYFLQHRKIVDANGNLRTDRYVLIIGAEERHYDGRVRYTAVDATLAGYIYVILANSVGDYVGDGTDQFNGGWITNDAGRYSNGDQGARIS